MLWTARGEEYAKNFVSVYGLEDLFDIVTGKPDAIVDDKGWSWIKYTRIIRDLGGY